MNSKTLTFKVPDWMVRQLKLQNDELIIYAFIYSFNCYTDGSFYGGINYICQRTNISRSTVIRCLKSLTDSGYLLKYGRIINNQKYVEYKCSVTKLEELGVSEENKKNADVKIRYITIYDWMIEKYNLSGHSLTVFSLLHSFTMSQSRYSGTKQYIAERLNMSAKQVTRILDKLLSYGFISYYKEKDSRRRRASYCTVFPDDYEDTMSNEQFNDTTDEANTDKIVENNEFPLFCANTEEEIKASVNEVPDEEYFIDLERHIDFCMQSIVHNQASPQIRVEIT